MIEHVQRTGDVDFKSRRQRLRFLFLLLPQRVVQILQNRHVLRAGIGQIRLIDDVHGAVNDGFLNRLQAIPAANDQLTQRQDEVRFQGKRILIVAVVKVDIHGIDVGITCG